MDGAQTRLFRLWTRCRRVMLTATATAALMQSGCFLFNFGEDDDPTLGEAFDALGSASEDTLSDFGDWLDQVF